MAWGTAWAETHPLESDSYRQRQATWQKIRTEIQNAPQPAEKLRELRTQMTQDDDSFETFYQWKILERDFGSTAETVPASSELDASTVDTSKVDAEVAFWLEQLTADDYRHRVRAENEILQRAQQGEATRWVCAMRRQIVEQSLGLDDALRALRLEKQLRRIWFESIQAAPPTESAFTDAELADWVQTLACSTLELRFLIPFLGLEKRIQTPLMIKPGEAPWGEMDILVNSEEKPAVLRELRQCWGALRSLEDALTVAKNVEKVRQLLLDAEKKDLTQGGTVFLQRLKILLSPCIASEYWIDGRHLTSQIIVMGVPQRSPDLPDGHATYFTEVDETTTVCADGYSLHPGRLPLEQAIPHPRHARAIFYLVNLATPLRQLSYPFRTAGDMRQRSEKVAERTLLPYLENQKRMNSEQLTVLDRLNPSCTSRLVGRMLNEIPDGEVLIEKPESNPNEIPQELPGLPEENENAPTLEKPLSHTESLCQFLMRAGRKEAVSEVLRAIQDGKIPSLSKEHPQDWGNLILLAIAERDPWEDAEKWLLDHLEDERRLVFIQENSSPMRISSPQGKEVGVPIAVRETDVPQLGATATAILAKRHELQPESLGLAPVSLQLPGKHATVYRFSNVTPQKTAQEIRRRLGL